MTDHGKKNRTAGAFDLRYILALLFIIYGVIITIMGGFASRADLAKAGGWNLNLWCGVAMIIVSLLFAGWARWRPIKVDTAPEEMPTGTPGQR